MEEKLKRISAILLREDEDIAAVWNACKDYKSLLLDIASLELSGNAERTNLPLKNGEALGTTWAAYCLDDILRTKRFIRGTYLAVAQLLTDQNSGPVHLLYAGTGPFAALALPLTQVFTPEELQLTLLEINPISFKALERVIGYFKIDPFVRRLVLDDATQYQIPTGEKVDILLSETMQAGLRKEAQVPIAYHLLQQPEARGAILIPERIQLQLGLFNARITALEDNQYGLPENAAKILGSYFELSRQHILAEIWTKSDAFEQQIFPFAQISVPDLTASGYDKLAIFTEIAIFQEERLGLNESGLTIPLIIRDLLHDPLPFAGLKIAYSFRELPGERIEYEN